MREISRILSKLLTLSPDSLSDFKVHSVRASATFPGLPVLSAGRGDVVWARIAPTTIAGQDVSVRSTILERAILAVPIRTTRAKVDHRAPRGLGSLRVSRTEAYRCNSNCSHQNCADHLSTSNAGVNK